jgi:glycosyltransferase involved in cell wall biosynthesis
VILFLHNRYRTTGGEERAVADFLRLLREEGGEEVELLERDSATLGRARAAVAMLRGGIDADDVAAAVRRTGADLVHAHNVLPVFGWRALAAARGAGARTILHLHNYRLVCAVGTCFTHGEECTRCYRRNTMPGIRLNCRGDRAESAVYGTSLALHQRHVARCADVFALPSAFAHERLERLGAPLGPRVAIVPPVVRPAVERSGAAAGTYALVAGRLAPEKGIDIAIAACANAELPLVVAGAGPEDARLKEAAVAGRGDVTFTGHVSDTRLDELRAGAAVAIVPSRSAETFGLAAAEAMAAGVPVVASAIGALPELVPPDALVRPGDVSELARALRERWGDEAAGEAGLERARQHCSPAAVLERLRALYALAEA